MILITITFYHYEVESCFQCSNLIRLQPCYDLIYRSELAAEVNSIMSEIETDCVHKY